MCGIFGYVGKRDNAADLAFEGLRFLEYRGYDSWGVGYKKNGKIVILKQVGKLPNTQPPFSPSNLAISHSRWATHGGVTVANAHPHLDCGKTVAVIHNGIIENFEELKKDLIKKGHTFLSETDTEVVPHLIEQYLKKEGFASAVRDSFNQLKGLNAIVVAYAPSTEIVAAKTGSPLVVGIGKNEFFVASDAVGILRHTNKVIFLEDNQMVILGKGLKLISLPKGQQIKPEIQTLDWKFEQVEKGKFKHFFLKEVYEQPRVIKNIALNYDNETKKLAKLIENAFGTFMLACGSASHAALFGTYLFSTIAKKHINFSIGSEFTYIEDYLTPQSLLIPLSQSGESVDVIEPVVKAKKKGSKIVALVNTLGSTLYRYADEKILLGAGPEKCVIATKSFIAKIAVLILTAYTLAKKQKDGQEILRAAAENVEDILTNTHIKQIKNLVDELKRKEHIYVLGRGLSYATALETALKIKETTYVHAEGFAGGELKHGVIALIDKGTPCIIIAPNDETYDDIISNAQEVKARGGFIIGIGPKNNQVFDRFLQTADVKEATIISQVVIAQLLAYYLALARGIEDPDKPRNLAKSVTVK